VCAAYPGFGEPGELTRRAFLPRGVGFRDLRIADHAAQFGNERRQCQNPGRRVLRLHDRVLDVGTLISREQFVDEAGVDEIGVAARRIDGGDEQTPPGAAARDQEQPPLLGQ
jgi:hypothetical protein